MTRQELQSFINALIKMRDSATDEQALNASAIYPIWRPYTAYESGKRVCYDGVLYTVLQTHTSQEDWVPQNAPSLFAKVLIPDSNVIPEWQQPESTNPYMLGNKVTHNNLTWISTIDNNVWEPGVYGWDQI